MVITEWAHGMRLTTRTNSVIAVIPASSCSSGRPTLGSCEFRFFVGSATPASLLVVGWEERYGGRAERYRAVRDSSSGPRGCHLGAWKK
ncbi:UNVERIFIED_CONTAM: hypothetical protein Slati_1658300 [Sesamum latifolium]|uniref:Uncharacterized protein n=1 Tax=Sesamum latifolium TaxID=2727402 RepID=A0AAW2XCQ9_9LAMI